MNKINQNFNKTYNSSITKQEGNKMTETKEQALHRVMTLQLENLAQIVERDIPENGKIIQPAVINFEIPQTNNIAICAVEDSTKDKLENRDLIVGVRHKNGDRVAANFLYMRKKKPEILAYLKDEASREEILKSILHLSDKTDEYYNSL